MRQLEAREMLRTVCRQLQMQANAFGQLGEHIPELPPGVDYASIESFPFPQYAQLQISVMANSRADALEVIKLFPARPLVMSPQPPYFRPREGVGLAELHGMRLGGIYPVIFSSFQFPQNKEEQAANLSRWSSRIGWYTNPILGNPMRCYVTCNIMDDPSRVYSDREENMPKGATIIPDSTLDTETTGIRAVHGFWDASYQNWETDFMTAAVVEDVEWPTTFDEEIIH